MEYYIDIACFSKRTPYKVSIGPYTRKHDAIRGMIRMSLPNLKNSLIEIYGDCYEVVTGFKPGKMVTKACGKVRTYKFSI